MKRIIILSLLISGCSFSPKLELPNLDLPNSWDKSKKEVNNPQDEQVSWWHNYQDPKLNNLIALSLKENSNILLAMNNVVKAQSVLGIKKSGRLPEVALTASATRDKLSKEDLQSNHYTKPFNTFGSGGVLSFQLDLWGKVANSTKAAKASLLAMEENKEIVKLTVASEVAKSYFNLISLTEKINLTNQLISNLKKIQSLNDKYLEVGWSDIAPLHQIESNLKATEQQLPTLNQALTEQQNALAILVGKNPNMLLEEINIKEHIQSLPIPPVIPPDIPAKILEQRPDIKVAQQQLIAANYEIGVAKAAYFPNLSLNAMLGLESNKMSKFNGGDHWHFGADVSQPIFNFGRISYNVKLAKVNKQDCLVNYQQTVKNAFGEVFNALAAQKNSEENLAHAKEKEHALDAATQNYHNRYNLGDVDYLKVLEAKQQLLLSKINSINYYQARLNASVELFKALGGNWAIAESKNAEEVTNVMPPQPTTASR